MKWEHADVGKEIPDILVITLISILISFMQTALSLLIFCSIPMCCMDESVIICTVITTPLFPNKFYFFTIQQQCIHQNHLYNKTKIQQHK
jgi:hypothetical protein